MAAPKTAQQRKRDEFLLNQLIGVIEKKSSALRMRLREDKLHFTDELRKTLDGPFEIIDRNKGNQYKNKLIGVREMRAAGLKEYMSSDIYHFSYQWNGYGKYEGVLLMKDITAGFMPISRTVYFGEESNFSNDLDMLVMYHEIWHSIQDAAIRKGISSREELVMYQTSLECVTGMKPNARLMWEVEAFAFELEMLNLVLDGQLATAVKAQKLTFAFLAQALKIRKEQENFALMLEDLAKVYFTHPHGSLNFSRPFIRRIAEIYSTRYRLIMTRNGIDREVSLSDL